ncbi:pyridoxamine 5'-phosphate oxidase family protein [Chryseolinea lacunae]|uniref:Pyridoxamine 5'-phosphate oxidase family protein n=1 Tax=Chryseolinea lacunae TaxID=2801331 RepID=A0ABS1L088_9BACT|nr:pyridoxamine 5'-phosphate oxidase family protein [Chryseolinea lacunae]MBL0745125.1 pyridoxamine 5'-phosphate oxidase family protein [Chryseolinea lacunae]
MENYIEKLRALIGKCRVGMLGTVEKNDHLQFRPMSHVDMDEAGNLWFFTAVNSEKSESVKKHSSVQLTYACETESTYVSIHGSAHLSTNKGKMRELFNAYIRAWFPKGLDDPNIALLVVRPLEVEYWVSDENKILTYAQLTEHVADNGSTPVGTSHGKMHA